MRPLSLIAGVCFLVAPVSGSGLLGQDANSQSTQPAPANKPADKSQKQPPKNVPDAPAPAAQPTPTAQQTPAPPTDPSPPPKHSTAQDNPFPEDISKKAAAEAAPDAPAANGAPAGDSSSRTGADNLDDLLGTKEKDNRTQLKLTEPDTGQPYDPKLAETDDRIGDFYLKNGDYAGAYARYKEASAANPGDPRAVFGLAESARKMNRTKEAADNYQVYLEAFPDGPKAKAARKALSELKIPASTP
jgi:tetratricopeptide (TPR) repeat protein